MSDIKLFSLKPEAKELKGGSMNLEKPLQRIIENNLEEFLRVKFIASEYPTGKEHHGRIDTLGIDENNCPVIIEYKRDQKDTVINQGLYYYDWLINHQSEFKLLVMEKYGNEYSDKIEWNSIRVICIAGDFNKFDEYAVKHIGRNMELFKYKVYGEEYLLLESIYKSENTASQNINVKTIEENLETSDENVINIYEKLREFIISIGEDVQERILKHYIAFIRFRNFTSVVIHKKEILVYLYSVDVNYETDKFVRDVSNLGHFGRGNCEIRIKTNEDLEKAKEYIMKSYEMN